MITAIKLLSVMHGNAETWKTLTPSEKRRWQKAAETLNAMAKESLSDRPVRRPLDELKLPAGYRRPR